VVVYFRTSMIWILRLDKRDSYVLFADGLHLDTAKIEISIPFEN
jgi:hypothetical protein